MKQFIAYILAFLLVTSCVPKKKLTGLETRYQQALTEKSGLEEVLGKVAVENDSLKKRIVLLDSLYRYEHEKNLAVNTRTGNPMGGPSKAKVSTMPKNVEYDKKALYVYNLPNYVFWPRTVKTDKFLIGIYGESTMKGTLASTVYGKKINDLPAIVEPYMPAAGKVYHMIFVAQSRQKEFYKLKKDLKDQPVLLITENPYLEKVGAHICFYVDGDKVRFNVNKKQIEKCGLHVSDQLIKFSNDN